MSVNTIYQLPSEQLVLELLRDALASGAEYGFHLARDGVTQDFTLQAVKQEDGALLLKVRASRNGVDTSVDAAPFKPANLYQHTVAQVNELLAQVNVSKLRSFDEAHLDNVSGAVDAQVRLGAETVAPFKEAVENSLRTQSLQSTARGRFTASEVAKAQTRDSDRLGGGVAI